MNCWFNLPTRWRSTGPSLKVQLICGPGWPTTSQVIRAELPSRTSTSSGVCTNLGFTEYGQHHSIIWRTNVLYLCTNQLSLKENKNTFSNVIVVVGAAAAAAAAGGIWRWLHMNLSRFYFAHCTFGHTLVRSHVAIRSVLNHQSPVLQDLIFRIIFGTNFVAVLNKWIYYCNLPPLLV